MLMKYMASVKGETWMQEHYVEMINECVNKHLWTLSKYKKFAWMLTAMCGVEQAQFHPWLGSKKKTGNNDKQKLLSQLYENMKQSDIPVKLFGKEFVNHFIKTREWECAKFRDAVTNWELKRYFEII